MLELPNELVAEVFCFADEGTLIKCSQVNNCWNELSKIRYVWEFKKVRGKNNIRDSNLKGICHVHTLDLGETDDVVDVSALDHVHTLDLSHIHTKLLDVSALGHIHSLVTGFTDVVDVSALNHIHSLNLYSTKNVEDVSALGHLYYLNLEQTEVVDVSALGHIHSYRDRMYGCGGCQCLGPRPYFGSRQYA